MNPAPILDRFINEVQTIENRIIERLRSIIKSRQLTDAEVMDVIAQYNFYDQLQSYGYQSSLNKFVDDMERSVTDAIKQAEQNDVAVSAISVNMLDNLVEMNTNYLLGRASSYGEELRRALLQPLIAGTSRDEVATMLLPRIQSEYKFYPQWMVAAVTQSLTQLQTTATAAAFADSPDQRFVLMHPIDRNTRRLCLHAIELQKRHPEGFTIDQINNGALDKGFVKRTPSENDKYDFINLGGFNCRGFWTVKEIAW